MDNPEGTNQPFTEQELTELKALLETEKQARTAFETQVLDKDSRITELEQTLSQRDAETNALKLAIDQSNVKSASISENLRQAVAQYINLVVNSNPHIPRELITGDTIEAIAQSLEKAKTIISTVRSSIEQEIASGKVPAGAPARTPPDLSALSPREKIQYAITKGGK